MVCSKHTVPPLSYKYNYRDPQQANYFWVPRQRWSLQGADGLTAKIKASAVLLCKVGHQGESTINLHPAFKMQDKKDTSFVWTRKEINVCARGEGKRKDGMIQQNGWIIWKCPTQPRVSLSGRKTSTLPRIQIPTWQRSAGAKGTIQGPGVLLTNHGSYRGEWAESVVKP